MVGASIGPPKFSAAKSREASSPIFENNKRVIKAKAMPATRPDHNRASGSAHLANEGLTERIKSAKVAQKLGRMRKGIGIRQSVWA
jgi:hypothetical protein